MGRKRRRHKTTSGEPIPSPPKTDLVREAHALSDAELEPRKRRRRKLTVALILALATVAVYAPILDNEFVNYDDDYYIVNNLNIRHGLSGEGIAYAFASSHGANWFPMTWLSWMLDYELYGLDPRGFHLTNVLIHVVSVICLFGVLTRMTGAIWRSTFVAGIFALHPLHVESVAWAAERKDVLSALFWILTMWAYARYVERPTTGRYVLVPLLLALGLMSKPMLVSLPFALLLLDVWPLERLKKDGGWRLDRGRITGLILEKVPLFFLVLVSSLVTFRVQKAAGAVQSVETFGVGARILNALLSYVDYIQKAFWPSPLSIYYPHPGESVSLVGGLVAGLILVGVSALAIGTLRKCPYLPVGWFWYLGTLVPVIGLVQVGQQAMADRYTYIPYIGLALVVAWGLHDLLERFRLPRVVAAAACGLALLALAVSATGQVGVWRDSISLFEQALSVTRDNPVANINLGVAYLNEGRLEEAEHHLNEAIRINPGAAEAHSALGELYTRKQKHEEALEHFRTSLRLDPSSSQTHAKLGQMLIEQGDLHQAILQLREAVNLEPNSANAHTNLGVALTRQGNFQESILHFQKALVIEPEQVEAHNNWGVALINLGRFDEAIEHFQEALAGKPDYVEAHYGWGLAAAAQRDFEQAAGHYREAVRLAPEDAELHYRCGIALANSGRAEEAVESFRQSVALEPERSESHYALGLALTELGRLDEATEQFRAAIRIEPDYFEAHYGLGIVLANQDNMRGAMEEYRRALDIQPDFAAAHNSWGVVLAGQGKLKEAITHFRRAVELQPELAEAHLNYGRALAQHGNLSEAERHFRAAVDLEPENADGHNSLGTFLARQGELGEAVESFRRALGLQPNHAEARSNLEKTLAAVDRLKKNGR